MSARYGGAVFRGLSRERSAAPQRVLNRVARSGHVSEIRWGCLSRALARTISGASAGLESRGLLGTARGIAGAIGVGTGAGEPAGIDDQVLLADRAAFEPAFEDLADAGGIASLGREACAGGVGRHAVVRHRPPGVILRGGLREPDVTRVAGELTGLAGPRHSLAIADLAARSVNQIRAVLHPSDQLGVEQVLGLRMEGC